jgi:hypothetical protein
MDPFSRSRFSSLLLLVACEPSVDRRLYRWACLTAFTVLLGLALVTTVIIVRGNTLATVLIQALRG